MKLLLDTVTILWIIEGSESLSMVAREQFAAATNDVLLSSVSVREILVKHQLGRLPLPDRPERFVPAMREQHGISTLPLEESATLQLSRLPALHEDPFDRMLICQAIDSGLTILTPDELVRQYPVSTLW